VELISLRRESALSEMLRNPVLESVTAAFSNIYKTHGMPVSRVYRIILLHLLLSLP
jgi:hypothetical protein